MSGASGDLREQVYRANMELVESGLVLDTFGNVSGVDREAGVLFIKPSGVPYGELTPEAMVPVSLETGETLEGELRPSSDTPTHLEIYRAFPCGGIAHTHSQAATTLAQARLPVRCMGTTHADFFRGDVPVTRDLTPEEIQGDYEKNTGLVIVEAFQDKGLQPMEVPAALVASHGPFTWGDDAHQAVKHSIVLEFVARMDADLRSFHAAQIRPPEELVEKHFLRKHGKGAYYGQE
ncbi:MAG: L-ribulose-5-phosphate 4-epimerase AraD [Gemmatimonadota bacterium]|jgi:L-ribulose-5-phosphate 4-epimerase